MLSGSVQGVLVEIRLYLNRFANIDLAPFIPHILWPSMISDDTINQRSFISGATNQTEAFQKVTEPRTIAIRQEKGEFPFLLYYCFLWNTCLLCRFKFINQVNQLAGGSSRGIMLYALPCVPRLISLPCSFLTWASDLTLFHTLISICPRLQPCSEHHFWVWLEETCVGDRMHIWLFIANWYAHTAYFKRTESSLQYWY